MEPQWSRSGVGWVLLPSVASTLITEALSLSVAHGCAHVSSSVMHSSAVPLCYWCSELAMVPRLGGLLQSDSYSLPAFASCQVWHVGMACVLHSVVRVCSGRVVRVCSGRVVRVCSGRVVGVCSGRVVSVQWEGGESVQWEGGECAVGGWWESGGSVQWEDGESVWWEG